MNRVYLVLLLVALLCYAVTIVECAKKKNKDAKQEKLPVCVYIRTYRGHVPWLVWLFNSLEKFFPDRNETVIAFPEADAPDIEAMAYGSFRITTPLLVQERETLPGVYQQQLSKLNADRHCQSDYILHVDSRTFFYRKVEKRDLFYTNKKGEDLPIQVFKYFSEFPHPEIQKWQAVNKRITKLPIEENFMIVNHHIYPRWAYSAVRDYVEKAHGKSLGQYIVDRKAIEGECRACVISEYSLLGAYLYYFAYDSAHWLDAAYLLPKDKQIAIFKQRIADKKAKKHSTTIANWDSNLPTPTLRQKIAVVPKLSPAEIQALKGDFLLVARTDEQGVATNVGDLAYAGIRHKEPTQSYISFMRQILTGRCNPDISAHYKVSCGSIPIPNTNSPFWPDVHDEYLSNVYKDMMAAMEKELAEERAKDTAKTEL